MMLGPIKQSHKVALVEEPLQTVRLVSINCRAVSFIDLMRCSTLLQNLCKIRIADPMATLNLTMEFINQCSFNFQLQFQDDEYRWAGVEDPKIMITTSRDPSSKLKQFAKELRLIFPGAQRLNRGTYEFKQLMEACRYLHRIYPLSCDKCEH